MPELAFDEESETRVNSVDIVATNETPSFQCCEFCLGPQRTPTLHTACASLDATLPADKDDAVDAGGKDNLRAKSIVASSSSPAAENEDSIKSLDSSSREHDPKSKLKGITADDLSLDSSGKEPQLAIALVQGRLTDRIMLDSSFESDQPGAPGNSEISPATATHKGKRKAKDVIDGPEAPVKINQKTAMSEAEAYWHNREQKPFEDFPDQLAGLGQYRCMQLMQEPEYAADPMDIQGDGPAGPSTFVTLPFVTFQVPSFSINFASQAGEVIPFEDEHYVEDPQTLGFEGLNITRRP